METTIRKRGRPRKDDTTLPANHGLERVVTSKRFSKTYSRKLLSGISAASIARSSNLDVGTVKSDREWIKSYGSVFLKEANYTDFPWVKDWNMRCSTLNALLDLPWYGLVIIHANSKRK